MEGTAGSLSGPVALMRTRAEYSPRDVDSCHCIEVSSQHAWCTAWPRRRCGPIRKRSTQSRRYAQISACPEKVSDQRGLRAKAYEYKWDGTSQAQPGELLVRCGRVR